MVDERHPNPPPFNQRARAGSSLTLTGNSASGSPLPNSIKLAYSKNYGRTWSHPITVSRAHSSRVFWPWIAAGSAGRVGVTWYRTDRLADPDCQQVTVRIDDAHVFRATGHRARSSGRSPPAGRSTSTAPSARAGRRGVATGQDRRLGDFFTNAIDPRGCELIASGDTTKPNPVTGGPRPTALPILIRQNSGRRLVGRGSC